MIEVPSSPSLNVLAGRWKRDEIPSVTAHVIRVYLCSAGSDSMTERDVFVEKVYPRLRAYCKDKYGLEFQVVDLNWGLAPGAKDSKSQLTSLRAREIHTCQALSASINFIVFLGQKYGSRPLADIILSEAYDAIQLALRSHKGRDTRNAPLLDRCYVLDTNSLHPVYVLKDKSLLIPEMNDLNEGIRHAAHAKWEELQTELRQLLQKGAELAYRDGSMDSESKDRYCVSELEKQISLGIEANACPEKKCILISRNIEDLKNYLDDPPAQNFADLKWNDKQDRHELDAESLSLLLRLKNKVMSHLSEENVIHHDVLWRDQEVIDLGFHKDYLQGLSEHLWQVCVKLIDQSVPLPEDIPTICHEITQHWSHCRSMASHFHNFRETTLEAIKDYVTGLSTAPLLVYGAAGCGKSKIISKLAFHMEDILSGDDIVVLRYIGHTAKSQDLRELLISVCTQVVMATGGSAADAPSSITDLVKYFFQMLASVPGNSRLVILLDGLELLLPVHHAFNLQWVPNSLPSHVKLVITLHHAAHGLLDVLFHNVLPQQPENFLEVPPITVDECQELLTRYLQSVDRSITPVQMNVFRRVLENEPLPLFVELLANIAKDTSSFTEAENILLPENCEEAIVNLFERLEAKHGRILVSRAFAYLVASVTGLSDCEMEDILSLDDDILNEAFSNFHPPVRRIPYIKWLSLKHEVEAFLSYKDADGVTVTTWKHDSFSEAVKTGYLREESVRELVHSHLADYFLGTWAGRPKPAVAASGHLVTESALNTDRKVPSQPHTFGTSSGTGIRFNKRMYDHVPQHLHLSCRYEELNSLVLFNYEWLYSKLRALSLQHVLADFAFNRSEESALVEEALRVSASTIEKDINSLPTELTGRLLPYYATHANIRSLIRHCDTDGLKQCALVPNFPYHQVPGSSLQFTFECPAEMDHYKLLRENRHLICKKRDDPYIHTFDLVTGEHKEPVFVSCGELYTTPNGKYFILVDHVTEKAIKIHDAETGNFLTQIVPMNHIEGKSSLYKKGPISITDNRLCAVVTLTNSILCICEIPSGQILRIICLDGKSNLCSITPDGGRVFCNSNAYLLAYDVYTLQPLFTVSVEEKPSTCVFTWDGRRAFLSNDTEARLTIMHLNENNIDMIYRVGLKGQMPEDSINSLTVSPNDQLLLVRGNQNLLVYSREQEQIISIFKKPDNIPDEFRFPRAHYVQMKFTHAQFTSDSNFVIGAIFRNVYVWQITSSSVVKCMQAQIGLITCMLVSTTTSQVVTHVQKSNSIQVWNVNELVLQVNTPDKLTDAIGEFQLTSDNSMAYMKCQQSDEIGVIDMRSGVLLDLLTHDMPVLDFAITPDGNWVLVSTNPRLQGTAFKLWNMSERQIILEKGNVPGYCVVTNTSPAIILVTQKENTFQAPFFISVLQFANDEFYEHEYSQTVKVVKSKPFVTVNDEYLVINSALSVDDIKDKPCIRAFHLANDMQMSVFDGASVKFEDHLLDILEVRPCRQQKGSLVAAIFSCKSHNEDDTVSGFVRNSVDDPYGFFLLDVSTGSLTLLCIPFPKPSYGVDTHPLVLSRDCSICLDKFSHIFHIQSGEITGQIPGPGVPPRAFALWGTVVLYYNNSLLQALRISDGALIINCHVHAPICLLHVCLDERTILLGCEDGAVLSYTIIDPTLDNSIAVLSNLSSRKVRSTTEIIEGRLSRSWDKVKENGYPSYSRPPSAVAPFSKEKQLLTHIQFMPRSKSETILRTSVRTQACTVM